MTSPLGTGHNPTGPSTLEGYKPDPVSTLLIGTHHFLTGLNTPKRPGGAQHMSLLYQTSPYSAPWRVPGLHWSLQYLPRPNLDALTP